MQNFNRISSLILPLALALGACAPGPVTIETEPAPVSTSTEPAPGVAGDAPTESTATFERSVPVVFWDDKTRQHQFQLVEPVSGQPIPGYEPIPLGGNHFHTFSPDQKMLAIVTFPSNMTPVRPTLHILDLATWKEHSHLLGSSGWVSSLAFRPDGKMLAIAQSHSDSTLTVFDLQSESVLAQTPIEFMATRMKFSENGENLMLYGPVMVNRFTENEQSGGPPVVALLNVHDLGQEWTVRLEDVRDGIYPTGEKKQTTHEPGAAAYYFPGVVFSPVEDVLYIVHPDKDILSTVDFASRTTKTVEIRPKRTWIERLIMLTASVAYAKVGDGTSRSVAISPDGQRLYSVGMQSRMKPLSNGEYEYEQSALNFQVIDASNGSELAKLDSNASDLSISPDGKTVFLRSWGELAPWTELFDVQSGQFVTRVEAAYLQVARRMDGSYILVSTETTGSNHSRMSAYSFETGDPLGAWTIPGYGSWLTMP